MMHMTFYWSREVTILFSSWSTDSWTSYAFTLLACFIVSAFYQYMEAWRIRIKLIAVKKSAPSAEVRVETPLIEANRKSKFKKWTAVRFAGAAVFAINSAIGYLLMLSVMSFNGGVFVVIVIGLATGYLVFRSGDDDEDENVTTTTVDVDNPCACS